MPKSRRELAFGVGHGAELIALATGPKAVQDVANLTGKKPDCSLRRILHHLARLGFVVVEKERGLATFALTDDGIDVVKILSRYEGLGVRVSRKRPSKARKPRKVKDEVVKVLAFTSGLSRD